MFQVILALIVLSVFFGTAYAFDGISLIRSDSCIATNCITLKELIKYDNSTQYISGKFVFDEKTGDYVRKKGMNHSYDYYKTQDATVIFVLPDEHTLMRTKKVIIQPSLSEFALESQKNKRQVDSLTDIRYTSSGMYANNSCTEITIGIRQVSITDALQYLVNDCPNGQTPILNKIVTNKTKVVHCGNDCQYKKFLKEAKIVAKEYQINKYNKKIFENTDKSKKQMAVKLSE